MQDDGYDLLRGRIAEQAWRDFTASLAFGFNGFPKDWELEPGLKARLLLRLQYYHFNPNLVDDPTEKRTKSWAFIMSFLAPEFQRKFNFLRSRLDHDEQEKWDKKFADYEKLLYLSGLPADKQMDWIGGFEAAVRHGHISKRVKIIKNKGLGLRSKLLGVDPTMTRDEIRARYRMMMKKHHPDLGGDPKLTQEIIAEYNRLNQAAEGKTPVKNEAQPKQNWYGE